MLVTCPECGAKISEQADRCPHCRFPEAGIRSREVWEQHAGEFEVEFTPPHVPTCHKCGRQVVGKRRVVNRTERKYDGYYLSHSTECPYCGALLKDYHIP